MKKGKRYVVDTNLLVSSILISGTSPDIGIQLIEKSGGLLVFSKETLQKFKAVLIRPKFDRYVSRVKRLEVVSLLESEGQIVIPENKYTHCRDVKDNKFLDAAVAGQVECLITGDDDLLNLKNIEGIPIIRMTQFLENPTLKSYS